MKPAVGIVVLGLSFGEGLDLERGDVGLAADPEML